ncbi:MAG: hypothetical protein CVT77_06510 [Alphaproteobacteria bacterium HGW-Alphaproteobacteria-16]|nr:MAG: hypothetical protein CVT77_06510 [Alphaproteobacteria bacterium HGW-Alphaproteobacteria-16]
MNEWLQLAIALVIVALVVWTVFRRGQLNPENTGKLSRQIGKLFAELKRIETKVDQAATASDFDRMRAELKRVETAGASVAMVLALEGKLNRMEERLHGQAETTDAKIDAVHDAARHARDGVARIEAILMKGALDR